MPGTYAHLADVRVDLADGGSALTGADRGRGVEVSRVFAALTPASESN